MLHNRESLSHKDTSLPPKMTELSLVKNMKNISWNEILPVGLTGFIVYHANDFDFGIQNVLNVK